jgi:hypothetical protein
MIGKFLLRLARVSVIVSFVMISAGPLQPAYAAGGRMLVGNASDDSILEFDATTGDFVLIADEVNPVIRELRGHGLEVTALHSHMLRETPRLFFMHFWAVDSPERIGAGLKAALSKIATR